MGPAPAAGNTADAAAGPGPTLVDEKKKEAFTAPSVRADASGSAVLSDSLNFGQHRRANVSQRQMKIDHPNGNKKKLKKFLHQTERDDRLVCLSWNYFSLSFRLDVSGFLSLLCCGQACNPLWKGPSSSLMSSVGFT